MATFSTNTPVNFLNDFSLLGFVANSNNYTNETSTLITVSDGAPLFANTIDMAGTFTYLPDMTIGTITSLTFNINPQNFQYAVTGLLDLDLNALRAVAALGTNDALEKIFEESDTIYGSSAGNDVLKGYGGADVMYGDFGDDSLDGGEGGDRLFGGLGNDSLDGGAGNDDLTGNADNDSLTGGAGNDALFGGDGIDTASYTEKDAAVVVTLNGSSEAIVFVNGAAEDTIREVENVVGGAGNDSLTGDALANKVNGVGGDDTLNGMEGDDMLTGGAGNDALNGGGGNDNLTGGSGNDNLNGSEGDDLLSGGAGADVMDGGAGVDTATYFTALPGAGDVAVTLNGANPVTAFVNGAAEDTLLNVENVTGGDGNDALTGDDFANLFLGNSGNDSLSGMKGNDDLRGGAGADTLSGGKGIDLLAGGDGADSFVFDAKLKKVNVDTLDDFVVADDTIHLADNIFKKLDVGALEFKQFHIGNKAHDNNDRLIYNADKGKLYYDADGKKDGFDKVLVAKLDSGLAMTHEDFLVV